jgi:hypothetical protein
MYLPRLPLRVRACAATAAGVSGDYGVLDVSTIPYRQAATGVLVHDRVSVDVNCGGSGESARGTRRSAETGSLPTGREATAIGAYISALGRSGRMSQG